VPYVVSDRDCRGRPEVPAQTPLARRYIAERGRLVENAGTFDLVAPNGKVASCANDCSTRTVQLIPKVTGLRETAPVA